MSSNDNRQNASFEPALFGVLMVVLYPVACFFAVIFTVFSLLAWNKPLTLWRGLTIEPDEARAFIMGGILGAIGLPVFGLFSSWLMGFNLPEEYWFYLVTGGYPAGAFIGIASRANYGPREPISPQQVYAAPTRVEPAPSSASPAPFQYATWDDEAADSKPETQPCDGCGWPVESQRSQAEPRLRL